MDAGKGRNFEILFNCQAYLTTGQPVASGAESRPGNHYIGFELRYKLDDLLGRRFGVFGDVVVAAVDGADDLTGVSKGLVQGHTGSDWRLLGLRGQRRPSLHHPHRRRTGSDSGLLSNLSLPAPSSRLKYTLFRGSASGWHYTRPDSLLSCAEIWISFRFSGL